MSVSHVAELFEESTWKRITNNIYSYEPPYSKGAEAVLCDLVIYVKSIQLFLIHSIETYDLFFFLKIFTFYSEYFTMSPLSHKWEKGNFCFPNIPEFD